LTQDEASGLRDRYFRERRMLLVLSVALLAREVLGISVSRGAEAIGLHFEISDPERFWWVIWAIWGWSLACCVQQLYSLRPFISFPSDRRTATWLVLQRRFARIINRWGVRSSFRRQVARENRVSYSVGVPVRQLLEDQQHFQADVEVRWRNIPERSRDVGLVDDKAVGEKGWIVRSNGDGRTRDGVLSHGGKVAIREPAPRFLWFAASAWVWIFSSFASDYVLPVVIGFSPLVIKVAGYEHAPTPRGDPSGEGPG
jgi:hypothetical protein